MHFRIIAETDIGKTKSTNQDSIIYKHGEYGGNEILMAIICDGMGGLSKGELASAVVVKAFSKWFDEELPFELENPDLNVIGGKWALMLKDLNIKLIEYAGQNGLNMGTTFTGALFIGDRYMITHVGDSRFYKLTRNLMQITKDHTFVARELDKGTITPEQAKTDKRRNLLLQCIGASENLEPDVLTGKLERGTYFICSDGFRHEISESEFIDLLSPQKLIDIKSMHSNSRYLIDIAKQRGEKDNISVILMTAE